MGYPVTYHCPHCETIVELERAGYLADKAVTPYPFEGWTYAAPDGPFEEDDADGVRFVCGESSGVTWDPRVDETSPPDDGTGSWDDGTGSRDDGTGSQDATRDVSAASASAGCGEPFYLSFVRYEGGREVDPRSESEFVTIDPDPRTSGPSGPGGPDGSDGGFR